MAATDAMICKGETFNFPCFGTQFESGQEITRHGAEKIDKVREKQIQCAVYNACGLQTEIIPHSLCAVKDEEILSLLAIIEAVSQVCDVPKGTVCKLAVGLRRSGKPVNRETLMDKCEPYETFHGPDVTEDGGCEENGGASGDSNDSSLTSASQSLPSSVQASENASLPSNYQRQLNCSLQKSPSNQSDNSSPDHRPSVSNSFQRPLASLPTMALDSHVANSTQSGLYNVAHDAGEDCTDGGNLQSNDGLDTWLVSGFSNPYVQIADSNLEYVASPLLSQPLPGVEHNMSANTSRQYELSNGKPSMTSQKTREQVPIVQQNSVSGSSDLTTAVASQDGPSCGLNTADRNVIISQNLQDIVCDGADCEISCQVNEPQHIQGVESKTDKTLKALSYQVNEPQHIQGVESKTDETLKTLSYQVNEPQNIQGAESKTDNTLKTLHHTEVKCNLLERENELLQNARLCCSCHEKPRGVTFLPCGHFITCGECAEPIYECPLCEKSILATINTFLS